MLRKKYTKPMTKGELSKLHGQDVRVHFLNDDRIVDKICKVSVNTSRVAITSRGEGVIRSWYYKEHYKESTVVDGVLVYKLPQIPHDIEW